MYDAAAAAYVTQANLVDRFGESEFVQLTDTVNRPASTIDGDKVAAAIRDAEALIDSYLAKRYALPLCVKASTATPCQEGGKAAVVPPVLTRVAGDIARYYLHGSRADGDHPVTMRYRDALSWLKDVAKGTVQLEAAGIDATASQPGAAFRGSTPVFARDGLKGV